MLSGLLSQEIQTIQRRIMEDVERDVYNLVIRNSWIVYWVGALWNRKLVS